MSSRHEYIETTKFCKDCKWCNIFEHEPALSTCEHPVVKAKFCDSNSKLRHPVTGKYNSFKRNVFADHVRTELFKNQCGKEALLFEERFNLLKTCKKIFNKIGWRIIPIIGIIIYLFVYIIL